MRVSLPQRCSVVWLAVCLLTAIACSSAQALSSNVLILDPTVTGGESSFEAQEVMAQGLTPVVVNDATWRGLSRSDFASYRAIVLGDATCTNLAVAQAAQDTVALWGPAVTGNALINGTDPVFHAGQGGLDVTQKAIDFVVANSARTGAYISLSCYYHDTLPGTAVPLLDALRPGGFTVTGVGCFNDAHIVASHPALDGLTDATISNWGCSVHEAFDSWPGDFTPLAIARDFGSAFTASDGTIGTPYMLASGTGLRSFPLSLDPLSQTASTGQAASVTAQLLDGATRLPVIGKTIAFRVSAGPNAGVAGSCSSGSCVTDVVGHTTFTYRGAALGDDTVQAWTDDNGDGLPSVGEPQTTARVTWARSATLRYVALGDSYSSGEGTFSYDAHKEAQKCHRGPLAWPRIIQSRVAGIQTIEHKACTGAETKDIEKKFKGNPSQIPSTPDSTVDLVTVTVGGNDVGFAGILQDCFLSSCASVPADKNFQKKLKALTTKLDTAIYPQLERAYPNATIVHVGYPRLTPKPGTTPVRCGWLKPDEQQAGVKLADQLNGAIVAAVKSHPRVSVASVTDVLTEHELCTEDSWMQAITAVGGSERGHPTTRGQQAYAEGVASNLGLSFLPTF